MPKPHLKLKTSQGILTFKPQDLSAHLAVSRPFFSGFNGWLPNPDPVLRKMGRQISVYRELMRDPLVGSLVRRRKAAVARLEWRLDGDDTPKNVRDFIDSWLAETDVYRLIKDVLNAVFYGYQPIELIWRTDSAWLPDKIIDLGLVFWLVTFKRGGLKFWMQFTEKYGAPWLIGKEPRSNTPQDTDKLLDALEALIGNSVGTIPNDSSVEIHEASGKASSIDAYDKLIRYCRSEISIALLGQDQTTEKDSTHASATAGLEVTDDIRDSDKRIVETTFNQLIEWVIEINFGDVARPKFVLFENEESGTRERAERDKMMVDAGAKFTKQYWQRIYGLEDGDLLEGVQASPEAKAADFTEGDLMDAGLVIDGLAPNSDRLNTQGDLLTAVLVAELSRGETAENLLDRLSAAYPNMDDTALQNELARLIFLSDLVGRIEVAQELKS